MLRVAILYEKELELVKSNCISLLGAVHALKENGIPFDLVEDQNIAKYCTVIVPYLSLFDRVDRKMIEEYLEKGGGLVVIGSHITASNMDILGIRTSAGMKKNEFMLEGRKNHPLGSVLEEFGQSALYIGNVSITTPLPNAIIGGDLIHGDEKYPGIIVQNRIVFFPFDLCKSIVEWETETYAKTHDFFKGLQKILFGIYWSLPSCLQEIVRLIFHRSRRYIQMNRKKYSRWPFESTADILKTLLANSVYFTCRGGILPTIWRWPKASEAAMVITHDIDTAYGMTCGLRRILEVENNYKIKTTWNFIAKSKSYTIDETALDNLKLNGFEIGLHGLYHDGLLDKISENDRRQRILRAKQILEAKLKEAVMGFRAPFLLRTTDLWRLLEETHYKYDMSFPDTDHHTFSRGGMGVATNMPYHPINCAYSKCEDLKILELPLSSPHDIELFLDRQLPNEEAYNIWKRKIDYIYAKNGLILFLFHPDKDGMGGSNHIIVYDKLLQYAQTKKNLWFSTAREVANWWFLRENIDIDCEFKEGRWIIRIVNRNPVPLRGLTLRIFIPKDKELKEISIGEILKRDVTTWHKFVIVQTPEIEAKSELLLSFTLY